MRPRHHHAPSNDFEGKQGVNVSTLAPAPASHGFRSAVKKKYGIVEQENEFLITCLFGPCAVCQEAREHKTRGH